MEIQNLGVMPVAMPPKKFDLKKSWPYILGGFAVVVAGIVTAWFVSGSLTSNKKTGVATSKGVVATANEAGMISEDFKGGNAIGVLEEGGIEGEGTYHLVREGGPSKYVYLTSSVIDLQSFVGKKVEIWGETSASKKAPWLMDVLKIKVSQ